MKRCLPTATTRSSLDGDNMRRGINADLGFSPAHRSENIRRVGEVAALFAASGTICISAFISPYRAHRAQARAAAGDHFHEIYVRAALATCERRDPKRLYERARAGEIANFTGIDDPYEAPDAPELVVDTDQLSVEESVAEGSGLCPPGVPLVVAARAVERGSEGGGPIPPCRICRYVQDGRGQAPPLQGPSSSAQVGTSAAWGH